MAKANKGGKASEVMSNGSATDTVEAPGRKKTECPVTRAQFENEAGALKVSVEGNVLIIDPKLFSTGSFGWYGSEKVTLEIDGVPVKCQAQLSFIVVNSKEAAAE